jgi:hypothetical protein
MRNYSKYSSVILVAAALLIKENAALEKTPRSMFLVKKAKISSEISGPTINTGEAQLRTIIDDTALHNIKKFE